MDEMLSLCNQPGLDLKLDLIFSLILKKLVTTNILIFKRIDYVQYSLETFFLKNPINWYLLVVALVVGQDFAFWVSL